MEKRLPTPVEAAFGKVLLEMRKERGLTQERLAENSRCHRAHVSFIERGLRSPTVDVLFRLASGLGVSPSEIVRRVEIQVEGGAE